MRVGGRRGAVLARAPQLLEIEATPGAAAAESSAVVSDAVSAPAASTSRILQPGQIAETMSRSRLSSSAQP